jgi:hypothetical protein
MLAHKDLLIIGDSFAAQREFDYDWPNHLCSLLTGRHTAPRGQGFSGAAWWSTRKLLLKELAVHKPKVLILCHTEAARIPSDHDIGLNISTVDANSIVVPQDKHIDSSAVIQAVKMHYAYLHSADYAKWAQRAWYQELDSILAQYDIEHVIHLHTFPPYKKDPNLYVFKHGITNKTPLWELCKHVKQDQTRNHFTQEQNIHIAHRLHAAIHSSPGTGLQDLQLV